MSDIESEIAHLYSWIRGVACRISCDVMDGEDLAHDTIIKALLNASRFHAGRDLKPWLMAIMANTYKSKMRHVAKIPFCSLQDEWTIIYRSDPDDRITCKSIVSLMQTDCRLRSLWLYVCGYDYCEIAAMTGTNTGTVKSRIYYARKRLKSLFRV